MSDARISEIRSVSDIPKEPRDLVADDLQQDWWTPHSLDDWAWMASLRWEDDKLGEVTQVYLRRLNGLYEVVGILIVWDGDDVDIAAAKHHPLTPGTDEDGVHDIEKRAMRWRREYYDYDHQEAFCSASALRRER